MSLDLPILLLNVERHQGIGLDCLFFCPVIFVHPTVGHLGGSKSPSLVSDEFFLLDRVRTTVGPAGQLITPKGSTSPDIGQQGPPKGEKGWHAHARGLRVESDNLDYNLNP